MKMLAVAVAAMLAVCGCADPPCEPGEVWCDGDRIAACADDGSVIYTGCTMGDTCHEGTGPTGSTFAFCAP